MTKILITSSVEKTIKEAAILADELGTGLEISRFPMMQKIDDDFLAIINDVKNSIKDFSGEISLHGLFSDLNPGSKDLAIREIAKKRYNQSFELAKEIGAKHIVFHSGHKGMKHHLSIENNQKNLICFWKEFIKKFEDNGITAVLENVLDFDYTNIITIVDNVQSPNLKVCLDTGHANLCSSIAPQKWIEQYGNRLQHLHLHNNYGTNDDHAGIYMGTVNFTDVIKTLKQQKTDAYTVFEIFNKQQLIESIKIFKNLYQ
jgi:sugar phosphate isomerase/epimerase